MSVQSRDLIEKMIEQLRSHVSSRPHSALGTVGVFHCHQVQSLHRVPIHHPSIVLVLSGQKKVSLSQSEVICKSGDMVLLPAGSEALMENIPCPKRQEYFALCIGFSPDTLERFSQGYGDRIDWAQQRPLLTSSAPDALLLAMSQRVSWCFDHENAELDSNDMLSDLRQQELLAICAEHKLLGQLLTSKQPLWQQRVSSIVSLDLAHEWRIKTVCDRLGVSESVLRRALQKEGTSFRDILEQARLVTALSLLQELPISIADVAASVGYQSQSRFTERFKQRFGLTPSELKQSREPVKTTTDKSAENG